MIRVLKKVLPNSLFKKVQPAYHWLVTTIAAIRYGFPSRRIKVIGITGTKGKTTTTELVSAILEEAGFKTAIISTLRFKIGDQTERNLLKMSMPGRFFLQHKLSQAAAAGCDYAVVEMTSEGAKLHRHNFIYPDALIFTNISPEHIESHGSYENYLAAKLKFAAALERSPKKNKILVVNADDQESAKFIQTAKSCRTVPFSLADAKPFELHDTSIDLTFAGEKIHSRLQGEFNVYNLLAAMTLAKELNISIEIIKKAIEKIEGVAGRVEKVKISDQQNFEVVVDYAHTADSLEKFYQAFPNRRLICVFGATGGGRDKWKRPEMGKVANKYCSEIILTDDDSYDEDPAEICQEIAKGIQNKKFEIITDRRLAIRTALAKAQAGDVVALTGKGTDPFLMGPNGKKTPWSDSEVAREELVDRM